MAGIATREEVILDGWQLELGHWPARLLICYNTPLLRKRPKKDPVRLPFPPMEGQGILFAAAAWR